MIAAQAEAGRRTAARPQFDQIALLLQGGGALGAYQGGVYEALAERDLHPDWVAGISIGAINAALIAGNRPAERVAKLRAFWEAVTRSGWWPLGGTLAPATRELLFHLDTGQSIVAGTPGFFAPRVSLPWLMPAGTADATSFYDTSPLHATLVRLVDFDRINARDMRLSVGAVNVRTGSITYFDNETHKIGPEHIIASGSLPPGFSATEIEGETYWDGGVVSNTPLQWVADSKPRRDTLAFQVDLWSARGTAPRTLAEVLTREKEIRYSSRTRAGSDRFQQMQRLRSALATLLDKLPPELHAGAEAELLATVADRCVYSLVQLIYRAQTYEGQAKDIEFSRRAMEDHWAAGYADTTRALDHPEVLQRPANPEGLAIFDFRDESAG